MSSLSPGCPGRNQPPPKTATMPDLGALLPSACVPWAKNGCHQSLPWTMWLAECLAVATIDLLNFMRRLPAEPSGRYTSREEPHLDHEDVARQEIKQIEGILVCLLCLYASVLSLATWSSYGLPTSGSVRGDMDTWNAGNPSAWLGHAVASLNCSR